MIRTVSLALSLTALLGGAACEVPNPGTGEALSEQNIPSLQPSVTMSYGPGPSQILDIYYPATQTRGVAFYVHGGAWVGGSRTELHPAAKRLVSQGWILVSTDYALASLTSGGVAVNAFPAAIHDVKRAIRFAKKYLQDNGRATTPFVGIGWSAGGHLVALANATNGALEPTGLPPSLNAFSSKLDGAVSIAGPIDLRALIDAGFSPLAINFFRFPPALTTFLHCSVSGDAGSCDPATVLAASAQTYYDASDGPLYVAYAAADPLVLPIAGCRLGVSYFASMPNRTGDYWADIVECASSDDPECRNHAVMRLNARALDIWLDALRAGTLPDFPPDKQPPLAPLCS